MLQYLVIMLDDTSTSYCHYENKKQASQLISLRTLKDGIRFGMKENLMIQFVYPDYELSKEYKEVIDSIDHNDIVSSQCNDEALRANADVVIFNSWIECEDYAFDSSKAYVMRTSKKDFFNNYQFLNGVLNKVRRLNVVITDIETFNDADFKTYEKILTLMSTEVERLYVEGNSPQLNLLTDRMMLSEMNNCNAGWENITLAPDGNFYVCSAFYHEQSKSIGSLAGGLDIKNPQLYRIDYAPICRHCDAYQCKRCIWLNHKMTLEVNTPSHEQCVLGHLERNASRELLQNIRKHGTFLPEQKEITEIDYLDPFENETNEKNQKSSRQGNA